MNIRHLVVLEVIAASTLMVSCFQEEIIEIPGKPIQPTSPSEYICFGAELAWAEEDIISRGGTPEFNRIGNSELKSVDGNQILPFGKYVADGIYSTQNNAEELTRGSIVSGKDAIDSFKAWATLNKSAALGGGSMVYFDDITYTKDANNIYNGTEDYLWPGDGTIDFTAVYPVDHGMVATIADNKLASFSYTTPSEATKQKDILMATAAGVDGALNASQPLRFKHIMSAVNIKIGTVTAGTIKSITLKNVYNKGTYNIAVGRWYADKTSTDNYTVDFVGDGDSFTVTEGMASGTPVNADDATFMFIPQEPGDSATMEVVFNNGQKDVTLSGSISGDMWDMGRTTNYMLSIDENLTMIISPVGKKLDAHYIIAQAEVTVDGFGDNDGWTLTVTDGQNRPVTVQPESEANPLAKQGFWTDKFVDANGNETSESARGSNIYSGNGNKNKELFYIFIPENISGADATITLTLKSAKNTNIQTTKVLLQKCPTWVEGGFGWETVDDDESGKYGFKWTRKVAYLYPYSWTLTDSKGHEDFVKNFVSSYGADANGFATVVRYIHSGSIITQKRYYILLDYTKLNNVTGADSATEGFDNTLALYRQAGTTATSQFETILKTTKKTESGKEGEDMFRLPTDDEVSSGKVPAESGQNNDLSAIMEYIQKKNRYNIQTKSQTDSDGKPIVSYVPIFFENDLKWYLPAKDQFQKFVPNPDVEGDVAANYWSSTTAGTTTAWTGGAEEKDRDLEYQVIAVRKNENGVSPATVVIDNSSIAGGENGDTNNWL